MNQETLEKEVNEYNEIIKKQQEKNQEVANLEQERLLKLGRIQLLQEQLSVEKSKNSSTPVAEATEEQASPAKESKKTKKQS